HRHLLTAHGEVREKIQDRVFEQRGTVFSGNGLDALQSEHERYSRVERQDASEGVVAQRAFIACAAIPNEQVVTSRIKDRSENRQFASEVGRIALEPCNRFEVVAVILVP